MPSGVNSRFWQGRPVLVTGATGLMGGWLVKELLERGAEVAILLRDRTPSCLLAVEGLFRRITVVEGCVRDQALLRRAMAEYSVATVFHLAAQPLVGVAKLDPVGTLEVNVQGTWQVLEAARQSRVSQVLIASSDKAYGASADLPYHETHPLRGAYPYDVSKSCADLIARMYASTYGLRVGITRCANLFGGGDFNFSRTIPGLIRSTYQGERFAIRSDGLFVRDYLYVKDAAMAYLTLAEHLAADAGLSGQGFNFSLSIRLTVLDLVRTVLNLMGRADLEPIIQNIASAEIREQYLNCDQAHDRLGWRPRYTLEQGLRETIDWYVALFEGRHERVQRPDTQSA